jgi:hypothetical protein
MQNYDNPAGRNPSRSAGGMMDNAAKGPMMLNGGKQVGGNANQGAGTLPNKVNVPLPGTNATQAPAKGGMKQNVPGFQGGVLPGKV